MWLNVFVLKPDTDRRLRGVATLKPVPADRYMAAPCLVNSMKKVPSDDCRFYRRLKMLGKDFHCSGGCWMACMIGPSIDPVIGGPQELPF